MRPRLRTNVTAIPLDHGMLLRCRDSYLSIAGRDAYNCFVRLLPCVQGTLSLREICSGLGDRDRKFVTRLVHTLRRAGMLHDATRDLWQLSPDSLSEESRPYLLRLGALTEHPLTSYEAASQKLTLWGRRPILLPLVTAALSTGICQLEVSAPDCDLTTDRTLRRYAEQLSDSGSGRSLRTLPWPARIDRSMFTSSPGRVVVAASVPADSAWLAELDRTLGPKTCIPFVVSRQRIRCGPFPAACLNMCLSEASRASAARPDMEPDRSLMAGARLLVQLLVDQAIESHDPRWSRTLYELDRENFEIRRRPAAFHRVCNPCATTLASQPCPEGPGGAASAGSEAASAFGERLRSQLVDSEVGLFSAADEFGLVQLPFHQSAVVVRAAIEAEGQVVTTEAGEDLWGARGAALRTAIEMHTWRRLRGQPPSIPAPLRQRAFAVASAVRQPDLIRHAFFKTFADLANRDACWSEAEFPSSVSSGKAALISSYLHDTGESDRVKIERHRCFSSSSLDVLRFKVDSTIVTVVVAPPGDGIWTIGLTDVWLFLSALKAFGPQVTLSPLPRLRASAMVFDHFYSLRHRVEDRLGLTYQFHACSSPLLEMVQPLRLGYGLMLKKE